MVIGFRQPQHRRRFQLSGRNKISRTREYYYSLYTVLSVKIVLFAFLWVFFGASVKMMRASFKNIAETWRFALPAAVAIIACIIGYQIFRNIKEIVRYSKELEQARKVNPPSKSSRT
jgi:uncharacterized integral membrane protein